MKKSHPIRHRRLAVRRAHRARMLAHRRQVEAFAALMGYRRAVGAAGGFGMWPQVFAALKERLIVTGIFGPDKIFDGSAIWKWRA